MHLSDVSVSDVQERTAFYTFLCGLSARLAVLVAHGLTFIALFVWGAQEKPTVSRLRTIGDGPTRRWFMDRETFGAQGFTAGDFNSRGLGLRTVES